MSILKRLDRIESILEGMNSKFDSIRPRTKRQEIIDWIESIFKLRKSIRSMEIMQLASEKGYSRQMVQKIKDEFCPHIKSEVIKREWHWTKDESFKKMTRDLSLLDVFGEDNTIVNWEELKLQYGVNKAKEFREFFKLPLIKMKGKTYLTKD